MDNFPKKYVLLKKNYYENNIIITYKNTNDNTFVTLKSEVAINQKIKKYKMCCLGKYISKTTSFSLKEKVVHFNVSILSKNNLNIECIAYYFSLVNNIPIYCGTIKCTNNKMCAPLESDLEHIDHLIKVFTDFYKIN